MNLDIYSLKISKVIVHDVPRHKKDDLSIEPIYSEKECHLTDGLKYFFRKKVTQSLTSTKSFKICYDTDNTSPVNFQINKILKDENKNLIEYSKGIAKHLFTIQVGSNAAGILVVITGKISGKNTLVLMKLEKDTGASLNMNKDTKSFDIEEVQNLMLTDKTKILKVALFVDRVKFKYDFDGTLADHQIDLKTKKDVTTWFMNKFLGVKAYEDPKITTQKFYNYTRIYIETLDDKLLRAKYIMDLNSYVQRNLKNLSPKEFADEYFTTSDHKDNYKDYLVNSKQFPFAPFIRDLSQIKNKVSKITLLFENDITLIGRKGILNSEKVKLKKLDDGQHKVEIISKIKKIT